MHTGPQWPVWNSQEIQNTLILSVWCTSFIHICQMHVIKWGNAACSSSEVSLFIRGTLKAVCPTVPCISLLKCCQQHTLKCVMIRYTAWNVCVCVCVRTFCHDLATWLLRVTWFITVCAWSYDCLYYFTFKISACECVNVFVHVLFAHSKYPHCVFITPVSTFCVCWCVTQPFSNSNSKLYEVAPFAICITCQPSNSVSQRLTGNAVWQ